MVKHLGQLLGLIMLDGMPKSLLTVVWVGLCRTCSWLCWSGVRATMLQLLVPSSVAVRAPHATPTSGTCGVR